MPPDPTPTTAQPVDQPQASRKILHVVFVVDGSGSMQGERIGALNYAVRAALPPMQAAALEHPETDVRVRVLRFADGAEWVVADPVPVARLVWTTLSAGGETSLGAAFSALATALAAEPRPDLALPPVIVLLSDGLATDDARGGLDALLATELGQRAVRVPIAIGEDADLDLLQAFIGESRLAPLRAASAEMLVARIRWASSVPVEAVQDAAAAGPPAEAGAAARAGTAAKAADDMLW